MISVVSLQLTNARDEKIQADLDLIKSDEYANQVLVSENNSNFSGPDLVKTIKKGVLATDVDIQTHFLSGTKNENGVVQHNLNIKIDY